jgi:aspartyl aminopeptidase
MTAATATGLCEFIDASPSPFHVCATVAARLRAAGYTELAETDRWDDAAAGRFFTVRSGSLIAWHSGFTPKPVPMPFRILGGHTDSPNLRVKQHPDVTVAGWQMVALEPYGGAWLNSWLDRDLGLSGRISLRAKDGGVENRLVRFDEPLLRVPQLAIHLAEDRNAVSLNPQRHINAVWGLESSRTKRLHHRVAERAGVATGDLLSADLMTHDLTPSLLSGVDREFVSAPRLDNQGTCYAGLEALLSAEPTGYLPVLALFDHEEVGSTSDHGAQSEFLLTALERIVLAAGGDREDFLRLTTASMVASGDMAHATHPN